MLSWTTQSGKAYLWLLRSSIIGNKSLFFELHLKAGFHSLSNSALVCSHVLALGFGWPHFHCLRGCMLTKSWYVTTEGLCILLSSMSEFYAVNQFGDTSWAFGTGEWAVIGFTLELTDTNQLHIHWAFHWAIALFHHAFIGIFTGVSLLEANYDFMISCQGKNCMSLWSISKGTRPYPRQWKLTPVAFHCFVTLDDLNP